MTFMVGDKVKFKSGPFAYLTSEGKIHQIDRRSDTYPLVVRLQDPSGDPERYMQIPCSEAELERI
jgi:hypothetical protein